MSVFAENSHKWLLAEQAIMKAGAYNAVRGKDAPVEELQYIYDNSKSMGAVVETSDLMMKISADNGLKSEEHGQPKFIVVLYPKGETSAEMQNKLRDAGYTDTTVLSFDDFMASSNKASFQSEFVPKDPNSLATLVYTSGTLHTYDHPYIQMLIQTYAHIYIYIYIYLLIHTYAHTNIYSYIHQVPLPNQKELCLRIRTYYIRYLHICILTYTLIHRYTHTYTHTYIYSGMG